jgi:hypothetical protein
VNDDMELAFGSLREGTPNDEAMGSWLYRAFGRRYRVVLRGSAFEEFPNGFTFHPPYYAIPCEAGVEITSHHPSELRVLVIDNPGLMEPLHAYVDDPRWEELYRDARQDPRGRMFWPLDPDDVECRHTGTLLFPADDLHLLVPILRPLRRG